MSRELQPPLSVSLVKIELPTVIKNEPPESEIVEIVDLSEEEIIPDVKEIDIVYHPLCEESIKSETLESKYCESVETQVSVEAENSPFIKTENITQRNKGEDTSAENVTKGIVQAVVEIQGSHEHSNTLSNLETHEQFVFNSSKDLNGIGTSSRKAKHAKRTYFVRCYKTDRTTSWEKEKEKIKIIRACDIHIESHEYTSLAKDKYVCNHCQHTYTTLKYLKLHIKRMHREVTTMYQCPYCSYRSKWNVQMHIIQKHKDTKDIQWFQCHLCEKKFKLKSNLTQHMKIHLTHEQMQDLKRHHCDKCNYKTDRSASLKNHNLIHLKPEEIEYFYCYHCSYKSKEKKALKSHIFTHHFKNVKYGKRHLCDKCNYKTDKSTYLKNHKLTHLKPEEIQYFYCFHCTYKSKLKFNLKNHIFRHYFKNVKQGKRYHCDKCEYKTYASTALKNHKLTHLKPEEIQYFYCYHCSYKTKWKVALKQHIFKHFKKEQVKFDCYICNFRTPKRELIIKHIKKHSKVQNKSEINEGLYVSTLIRIPVRKSQSIHPDH